MLSDVFELFHGCQSIISLGGGRLKFNHMEMLPLNIGRKMDTSRMFAVWRIDPPWQPLTRKGHGQRMGGRKGAIDEYVTPVKAGRIIFQLAGKCEYFKVKDILEDLAKRMPFKGMAVSQDILDRIKQREEDNERNNLNRYTMKYLIQNNMGGCHRWLSPYDLKWFGKYV
ncbi:putative ribosomal protein L16p/L10e [Trypoxylus dichotomus]